MNTPGKNEDIVKGQLPEKGADVLKQSDKPKSVEPDQEDKLIGDDYEIALVQNGEKEPDETAKIESENY